ncbi:MAG: hypothetical protein AB1642_05365 [Pseudomonadota bacterium]
MCALKNQPRNNYFSDQVAVQGFNLALNKYLASIQKKAFAQYLSHENTLRLRHGDVWKHPANPEASDGGMKEHSVYSETKFQDIVDHRLELIDLCVTQLSEEMHRQFAQMMYSTVNEACNRSGNIVEAKGMPLTDAFISMIEKISFSADRNGEIRFPEVHAPPDLAKKMIDAVEAAPPEYKKRLEDVTERKSKEALEREAERKAKFLQYGEE